MRSVAISREDDSIVLAGYTSGAWADTNKGPNDFAAIKLDSDGNEIWKWQVRVPDAQDSTACGVIGLFDRCFDLR